MTKRLISFFLTLVFLVAVPLSATYKYNPYTRKLDYYERVADADLGDLGDVTLTGLATGNVLYYDGAAWVNLATGANTEFLTLAAGIPAWAAIPAGVTTFLGLTDTPGAYAGKAGQLVRVNAGANALEFFAGSPLGTVIIADGAGGWTKTENYRISAAGAVTLGSWTAMAIANAYVAGINQNLLITSTPTFDDLTISTPVNIYGLSHNSFADYAANRHVVLPNTLANVLSDHNLGAHTALGLFDASSDVDHDATTNYLAAQHLTLPAGIVAVLTDHDKAAHDALLIDADTVDGEHAAAIVTNARVKAHFPDTIVNVLSDHNLLAHTALGLFDSSGDVDHDLTTNYAANQHVVLPGTIANVLSDHNIGAHTGLGLLALPDTIANVLSDHTLLVHTTLGLFDASSDVDHDLTTNYAANQHVVLPGTIANVLSDHNLAAHTGLGLFDASSDVDHNATTNYFIYNHVGEDHVTDHNLWIGYLAGEDLAVGGQYNTFFGEEAGKEVTTGDDNVIIGYQAGYKIETGSYNVYVGKEVAYERTDGNENVIIGWQAGYGAATSTFNNVTIVGTWAGFSLNLGDENNLFGAYAASELTDGADNCVFGTEGMYYNETGNHNVVIGNQAGMGVTGQSYSSNVFIGNQVAKNVTTGSSNVVIGYMAGEGWLVAQSNLLIIANTDTTTPLIYGDFSADNITINGDFNVTMDAVLDQIVIAQSAVAGTENQPLIFINDDRTGATVDEIGEATIVIDAEGFYALYILDGQSWFATATHFADQAWFNSNMTLAAGSSFFIGGQIAWLLQWDINGAADDLFWFSSTLVDVVTETAALFYSDENPNGMTDHDNYLSPTFVITNSEGADANDYAGVVIGERAQADVKVAHYFDFYAMVGSADGVVDPANAEIAATFRFGDTPAVAQYATGPGDVVFNDDVEIDGTLYMDTVDAIFKTGGTLQILPAAGPAAGYVEIQGNGMPGTVLVNDSDGAEFTSVTTLMGTGWILTGGLSPQGLYLQTNQPQNVSVWPMISSGNPYFYIYGHDGGAVKYIRTSVDSNGDALIEPQNDLSILKGDGVYSLTVDFDDADPTVICAVADGYVVTDVWIEVTTGWDGNGYIEVGDGGDDDGFMNNTNYDDSTPGYYGFDISDRGDYLTGGLQYIYTGADTVDIKVNTGTSTQGVATVYVHITRLK